MILKYITLIGSIVTITFFKLKNIFLYIYSYLISLKNKSNEVNNSLNPGNETNFNLTSKKIFFSPKKEDSFKLKDYLIVFSIVLLISCLVFLIFGYEMSLIVVLLSFLIIYLKINYNKLKKERYYGDVSQELPYLLRHMATNLKSGKGLHDVFISLSKSDYGSLSLEFQIVAEEIKYGRTTEDALKSMSERVPSNGLRRANTQIIRTLKSGGNLSKILTIIAEDVFRDLSINLKEYSQKLNVFVMIYMFIAILAPVVILTMITATSMVMGDFINDDIILIIFVLFFPAIICFLLALIKKIEPKV